ncbi:aminopeptidase [Faecalicatena contorta]|uniref:aminopeptidase n=1 Tax=Faecalicatena contorta TaxID=39482 RepID=UPI001F479460|nr:aminopeptidase [Faecalicatena contorta]MCF2680898.1 aminopeptidase [Faecalicatena contorta]
MIEERYDLAADRIREMKNEQTVGEIFRDYFQKMADFAIMIDELKESILSGAYYRLSTFELEKWNERLYQDILPENYESSYANPAYAVEKLGEAYGQILSFLYTELRGSIVYAFEKRTEYLDILFELLIEVYNQFEEAQMPDEKSIRETIYWYASDYCDVFVADRIREQVDPEESFAADIICNCDLDDERYLYFFGEYISDNERKTAAHLAALPQETIQRMAFVYTEGYRMGFVNTGKDLSRKSVVNIRYVLGFERVVRQAIRNFEKMGLKPSIYRSSVSAITKRQHLKIGYYGGIANKQYEYDHKDDQGLFLDKQFIERKLEVMKTAFEKHKELAAQFAGPACMETFGEEPYSPVPKKEAIRLTKKQEEYALQYDSKSSQMTNQYIRGDERSFTIVAYPVPEIGEKYAEIFDEIIRINTLDAKTYERVQQTMIDALDQGEYVHILGGNGNRTDLKVQLHKLQNPQKETIFENCVADVNIPVGEVFTSPVLEGTNGVLHVSKVYLNELQYRDLEITFSNGMIADYNCSNFERELENKEYIHDNILHRHPTLPLGEFAIGTNTTAYVAAKKYGIEEKMPILIAEKMGPHFAVGDTCYSWSEDIKVYNPNGKEIIARDNSVSALRKEDVSKAYFHCHTDITIPYEELRKIVVVTEEGKEILILEDGEFVLPGTEILNEPLKNAHK